MKIRLILVIALFIFLVLSSRSQSKYSSKYFPYKYHTLSFRGSSVFSYVNRKTFGICSVELSRPKLSIYDLDSKNPIFLRNEIDSDSIVNNSGINCTRLALVGGALVTTMTAVHIYQQNGWWKDNRAPFHFKEDLIYGLRKLHEDSY